MRPVGIGIVGCGTIVSQYLATLARLEALEVVAVADLDGERARAVAAMAPGARALGVPELLAAPGVDVVVNLTTPEAHAEVSLAAIAAGKDVYTEKPLAADTEQGRAILAAAHERGVRIASAPDTVLGTGIQTARKAVDDGALGTPVAASATMCTPGHERWHPNPDFFYRPGGGPLYDMGPYYLTTLVTLVGPVARVIGAARRGHDMRTIGTGPRTGERIPVGVDTHAAGVLVHESGVLSTIVMSFDSVASKAPPIEVHGTRASMIVPNPNDFDGAVLLRALGDDDWRRIPTSAGFEEAGRGCGLADLVQTTDGDTPRAGAELAYHVLEVMESLLAAARTERAVEVESRCERPRPVPLTRL